MSVAGHGVPDPRVLLHEEHWKVVITVVDVGGGTVARASLPEGGTILGQSFFDPLPAGADLYVLKSVLADWPDVDAVALLRWCAGAARPADGRVVYLSEQP